VRRPREWLRPRRSIQPEATPDWVEFQKAYRAKFNADPDAYAAYAYDRMHLLIAAVEKSGLNRAKIMDALPNHQGQSYDGVAGSAQFDYTLNNIAPIAMAHVEDRRFVYSVSTLHIRVAGR
jgi:branched-chain amino acid transport system substrate-binding protein